jgi:hypothetical protein
MQIKMRGSRPYPRIHGTSTAAPVKCPSLSRRSASLASTGAMTLTDVLDPCYQCDEICAVLARQVRDRAHDWLPWLGRSDVCILRVGSGADIGAPRIHGRFVPHCCRAFTPQRTTAPNPWLTFGRHCRMPASCHKQNSQQPARWVRSVPKTGNARCKSGKDQLRESPRQLF